MIWLRKETCKGDSPNMLIVFRDQSKRNIYRISIGEWRWDNIVAPIVASNYSTRCCNRSKRARNCSCYKCATKPIIKIKINKKTLLFHAIPLQTLIFTVTHITHSLRRTPHHKNTHIQTIIPIKQNPYKNIIMAADITVCCCMTGMTLSSSI